MQRSSLRLKTPSSNSLVPLSILKSSLRIEESNTVEDSYLMVLAATAKRVIENHLNIATFVQNYELTLDYLPSQERARKDGRTISNTIVQSGDYNSNPFASGFYNTLRGEERIVFPIAPFCSILEFKIYDVNDVETIVADTDYRIETQKIPGEVITSRDFDWGLLRNYSAIKICFDAGFGYDLENIPIEIQACGIEIANYAYNHRGDGKASFPDEFFSYVSQYRVWNMR